jgi:hypothetical protein
MARQRLDVLVGQCLAMPKILKNALDLIPSSWSIFVRKITEGQLGP